MRSFIAIELSEATVAAISKLQEEFKKCDADVRWVKPGNIHLTLKFLGDIEEKDARSITEIIKGSCYNYAPFKLDVSGVGIFPNVRSPRVLWVGMHDNDVLTELQKELDEGMASLGFKQEKRRFVPHLTLGRFRSSRGKGTISRQIEAFKNHKFGKVDVRSVCLMKSELSPSGARYTKISEVRLGKVNV